MLARVQDLRQVVALPDRERVALQEVRQSDHRVQRRAQLVAHVGEEGALGDVGDFCRLLGLHQLPGSLSDEFLQVMPVPFKFLSEVLRRRNVLGNDDDARHPPLAIADHAAARGHDTDAAVGDHHAVFEIAALPRFSPSREKCF